MSPTLVTEYVTPARTIDSTDSVNHHVSLTAVQACGLKLWNPLSLNDTVPEIVEETVEVTQLVSQERVQQCTVGHVYGAPVPQIVEEIVPAIVPIAPAQAVDAAPARVIEHEAPISADVPCLDVAHHRVLP